MNDEQIRPLLDAWFTDRDKTARDASSDIARVMADVPQTRQQGRWWPLPAFDRPERAFPGRRLAPALIPATNRHVRPRGFTMLSALKFVAASVIVALFGGFLLAGILTTEQQDEVFPAAVTESHSPTTTEDLLSGMATEEIEPGVYRVINDGVRDLGWGSQDEGPYDIVAGRDGNIWLFDWSGSSVRLGDGTEYDWGVGSPDHAVDVTTDGAVWRIDTAGSISSFDGRAWTQHRPATNSDDQWNQSALKVGPGDAIWALSIEGDLVCSDPIRAGCRHTVLTSLDGDRAPSTTRGWSDLYDGPVAADALAVAPSGEVWLMGVRGTQTSGRVAVLLRYDGQDWQVVEVPDGLRNTWAGQPLDIGADGTLWAADGDPSADTDSLARLDDSGWKVFTETDGIRPWGTDGFIPTDHLHAAADGSVWVNAKGPGVSCDGVANFDGTTWTGYLKDLCVHDMDIAPDGAVWVRAGTFMLSGGFEYWDPPGLYVITPEAVTVTETTMPRTALESLPDMVTEEVEPGVRRVVNDGVRDVAVPAALQSSHGGLSIDPDGGIWIITQAVAYRLGEPDEATLAQPNETEWVMDRSLSTVTADGTLWGSSTAATPSGPRAVILSSFDGESWTIRATLDGSAQVAGIATTADGTAWATTVDSSQCPNDHSTPSCRQTLLLRIADTGASTGPGWEGADAGRLSWHKPVVSPDGDLWLVDDGDAEMERCSVDAFHRYDGVDWHVVDAPEGLDIAQMGESFGFGFDGTLWAAITVGGMDEAGCWEANHGLARLDESGWSVFTESEGVRPWGSQYAWGGSDLLRVAPDGSVWVNGLDDGVDCDGLANFDGVSWTPYMRDLCVDDLDITPDGTIWVLASGDPHGTDHLYVITPEAVSTSE